MGKNILADIQSAIISTHKIRIALCKTKQAIASGAKN